MSQNPFVRDQTVDKPGIVGARWWNQALRDVTPLQTRRSSFAGCFLVGAGVVMFTGLTVLAAKSCGDDDEDAKEEARKSLEMQKDYGWNFGAISETVAFETQYTQTYAREALKSLATDLSPSASAWLAYYVRTLFESPEAVPRLTLPDGDTSRVRPLAEALRPILTPAMSEAEKRGRGYAKLITQSDKPVLTIVDLAGPESVAFAAGAAELLNPVFMFDNWPHPRGVVPSHLTLAAAVYYQPVFAKLRNTRKTGQPAMLVLDRARLSPYIDDATHFDNRYAVSLPAAPVDSEKRAVYVVPNDTSFPERDDLNSRFVEWNQAGVEVRALSADALQTDPKDKDNRIFGGSEELSASFFDSYKWKPGATKSSSAVPANVAAAAYKPTPRTTTVDRTKIGVAVVMVAVGTGILLGSKLNRNGSWNRSSGGWGG